MDSVDVLDPQQCPERCTTLARWIWRVLTFSDLSMTCLMTWRKNESSTAITLAGVYSKFFDLVFRKPVFVTIISRITGPCNFEQILYTHAEDGFSFAIDVLKKEWRCQLADILKDCNPTVASFGYEKSVILHIPCHTSPKSHDNEQPIVCALSSDKKFAMTNEPFFDPFLMTARFVAIEILACSELSVITKCVTLEHIGIALSTEITMAGNANPTHAKICTALRDMVISWQINPTTIPTVQNYTADTLTAVIFRKITQ